ncbi:MAG: toxin-antitoxin system YwqK family antitoxin [Bacteroidia bacterium]|nr:toxin-antitoxin system YwqK family antitoxin [Bacteroidia bacterium]
MKNTLKFTTLFLFCHLFICGLKAKDFVSIEIKYDPKGVLALGQGFYIGIAATTEKGKVFETPGFLSPGLLKATDWSNFKIEVEGGTFEDGAVFISNNFSDIKNHEIKIKASVKDKPEVKNEIIIKLTYSGTIYAVFDGKKGKRGKGGDMGNTGGNGGSSQKATDGTPGGDGQQGGDGSDGENVDVYLKLTYDELLKKDMLQIWCVSKTTGKKKFIYLDPVGGKFIVTVNGGDGGDGGDGGRGGECGYDPNTTNPNLAGGKGGNGGAGGNGGNGGKVTLHVDPNTEKINTEINFSRAGGSAGKGGTAGYQGQKSQGTGNEGMPGSQGQSGHSGNQGPETAMLKEQVNIDWASVRNSGSNKVENKSNESSNTNTTTNTKTNTNVNSNTVKDNAKAEGFPDGAYNKKRENGTLLESGEYKNNKKVGTWKTFREDGATIYKQTEYSLNGSCKETQFGENGKILSVINTNKEGKRHGLVQFYDNNGILQEEITYDNDSKTGPCKNFSGLLLVKSGQYLDGKQNGPWKFYDVKGNLEAERTYTNGTQNGPCKLYYNGKLSSTGQFKDGKKEGEWKTYDRESGAVKKTENYKDGEAQP